MRIGFDAKRAFFNQRGLGNYSRDTIRILSTLNPDDSFFLFSPREQSSIKLTCGQNCQEVYPSAAFYRRHSSLWRSFGINKEIERTGLDIYHGLSHEIPFGIEKSGVRTVVTMHDLIFLQYPHLYNGIDRLLYRKKYFHSCRVADKIVAISEQTKRDIVSFIGIDEQKIEVVYQGCHPVFSQGVAPEFRQAVREKYHLPEQYILHVGAIEERKNQLLILKAMGQGQFDLPLVVVGRPTDYINELKAYISAHRLENRVLFLTDVSTMELPSIYQMASLFVYPSIFEGFGIPIVEAMTSGVPVITSKGSCFEETGGKAACYIHPEQAEELAFLLEKILSDAALRQSMIEAGRQHVRLFSDEKISEHLMALYQSLL